MNRSSRIWLCALVGFIALLAAPSAVGAQTSILNNGGFEEPYGDGAAGGWFKWHEELNGEGDCSNATILHKPQWSPEISGGNGGELLLEGQRSQHIGNQFATWHGGVAQTISVTPGTTYTFSAYSWGRASQDQYPAASDTGVNLNVRIGIDPTGGGVWSSSNIVWSGSINPHQSWQQVTVQATASSDTMTVFAGSNTGGANNCRTHIDIWFDNASLVASGPPPTNTPAPTNTRPPISATNTPRPTNTRAPIAATSTPWPTRTPWPTHTSTPIPPTVTATPTLTTVPTETPTPTSTLTPTPVTPSPTPLPTGPWFTKTPTPWPTNTPAPIVVNTVAPAVASVATPVVASTASTAVPQPTAEPTDMPEPTEEVEKEVEEESAETPDAATEEPVLVGAVTEAPPTTAPTNVPQDPQGGTICVNTFSDENSNGLRDTTEGYMAGISVVIGQDGAIIGQGSTTGTDDAVCFSGLEPSAYEVAQRLPSSLQMTTASNLEIAVESGQTIGLEFGSRLADLAPPTELELANAEGTDGMVSAETDPTSAPATNPPAAVESPSNGLNTTTLMGIGIMALAVVLLGGILITLLRKG